jgi:hypothetical protein
MKEVVIHKDTYQESDLPEITRYFYKKVFETHPEIYKITFHTDMKVVQEFDGFHHVDIAYYMFNESRIPCNLNVLELMKGCDLSNYMFKPPTNPGAGYRSSFD